MEIAWHHWAVLGILLMVCELIVPAFVMLWFGLGALVVAFSMSIYSDMSFIIQLQIWMVMSVIFVLLWFKVFKPSHHKILVGRSSADVVGEVGILVSDVQPFQKGQVRFQKPIIGSDVWDCMSEETLKANTRVKIASVEGNIVKIVKAGE